MMKRLLLSVILSVSCLALHAQDDEVWTLQECIDYALEHNLDVKRSRLNLKTADIALDQSRMALWPNANANAAYGYSWGRSIDPTTNLFVDNQLIESLNGNINSNVTVFNGFVLQNSIKQSKFAMEASQNDLETSKNAVILNVVSFYTNVMFTRELLENARKQLNSTEQQVTITEKQVEVGALPQSSLLDLLAQQSTNEVNVVTAENNYNLAKIQLKQALQVPPESTIEIDVPELEVDTEPVLELSAYEIYEIALNTMPEIRSAELNKQSSEMGVKVARGNLYPRLTLQAGINSRYSDASLTATGSEPVFINDPGDPNNQVQLYNQIIYDDGSGIQTANFPAMRDSNFEPISFSNQLDNNLNRFVNLNINIPIFNGFSARADIQRSVIAEDRADINMQDAKYQLWQNIEQSYYDVLAAAETYTASVKQVEAREESFRVTKQRYDLGAVNFTDYQIAENDLFQARSDLLRAKYDYIFKLKVLDFYQGKPLDF